MSSLIRQILMVCVVLAVIGAVVLAMMPRPVEIDAAAIVRAPMIVAIEDDGKTRIRERYVVSAPLSGRLVRIKLDAGDEVLANETLLTTIEPTEASLLDPRAVAQAEARVKAAEARFNAARPKLESARIALSHAESEMGRLQKLVDRNSGSQQALEQLIVDFRQASNAYESATFEIEIAKFELDVARAALTQTGEAPGPDRRWDFPIRSPISGRVLRVFQESSTIIKAGERILEVGDPGDLEVEVDVLSTDAVRIRLGSRVILNQWGGDRSLNGTVRLVEPSAYTKVSALGIEEQRVNVIIDLDDQVEARPRLGDGFRVEAAIIEWEASDVLVVPTGALFRDGNEWAVFVVHDDRAIVARIRIGHRNEDVAEVKEGLDEGDRVILYPGDRVSEGAAVTMRTR